MGLVLVLPCVQGLLMDRYFLVKITPWGKLLQFSWGKLLHSIVSVIHVYEIGLKCNQITPFIKFYSEIHHIVFIIFIYI